MQHQVLVSNMVAESLTHGRAVKPRPRHADKPVQIQPGVMTARQRLNSLHARPGNVRRAELEISPPQQLPRTDSRQPVERTKNAIDLEPWIPREQIVGPVARQCRRVTLGVNAV